MLKQVHTFKRGNPHNINPITYDVIVKVSVRSDISKCGCPGSYTRWEDRNIYITAVTGPKTIQEMLLEWEYSSLGHSWLGPDGDGDLEYEQEDMDDYLSGKMDILENRVGVALQLLPNGNCRMVAYGPYQELTLITPEWASASREDSIKESDEWLRKYRQYVQDYIRAITIREEV